MHTCFVHLFYNNFSETLLTFFDNKTVYEHNVEILAKKDIVDNTLIDKEHKRIMRKVIDTDKFEELLKFNSKS